MLSVPLTGNQQCSVYNVHDPFIGFKASYSIGAVHFIRKALFDNNINDIIGSTSALSVDKLINLLLYGDVAYSEEVNNSILKNTIVFLKSSERFDMPLL